MRLLPPPWEGLHPAFPKPPEPHSSSAILSTLPSASTGGLLFGVIARIFSTTGGATTLAATGTLAMLSIGYGGLKDALRTWTAKEDVYPVLRDEKIEVPPRQFFESTKNWSYNDSQVIGAAVGLATFAVMKRPLPGSGRRILRALGAACFGSTVGGTVFVNTMLGPKIVADDPMVIQQSFAKQIYESKTGKPGPRWLYPLAIQKEEIEKEQARSIAAVMSSQFGLEHDLDDGTYAENVQPQPIGSSPHPIVLLDGKAEYQVTRDYTWRYENSEEGLRLLNKQLNDLTGARKGLVEMAEFLWIEVAKRERRYHKESDPESADGRQLRKALELLSSMHSGVWGQISDIDWLIADTKKIMLQIQKGGDWIPENPKSIDLKTYRPERILELIRRHKENTTRLLSTLENMAVPYDGDQEKLNDSLKEVRENDMATENLVREMEERVRNPSSSSDLD